jgi:hypothetical protein
MVRVHNHRLATNLLEKLRLAPAAPLASA